MNRAERVAVQILKWLAENWPPSLWIFVAGNSIHVMRYGPDGKRVMTPSGGYDQSFIVYSEKRIRAEGGDW